MTFASDGTFDVVEFLPKDKGGCKGTSEGVYSFTGSILNRRIKIKKILSKPSFQS